MLVELKVPALPESVTEGTLGEWHKKVGDSVAVDENVVDLETDKVVLEIVATKAGVIESMAFETGDTVKNDDVLGVINTEVPASSGASDETEPSESKDATGPQKASPAVRKIISENDLSIDDIKATGKKGQVLKEDVLQHLKQSDAVPEPAKQAKPTSAPPIALPVAETPTGARNDRRVPMTRLRARIAERLKQAQNTAALLTTFNEVNLKPLMDARAKYKEAFEKAHAKQLGLKFRRQFTDLVEKERTTVRQCEVAGLPSRRTGKCALFMSKELALDQSRWNRSAVDLHERPVASAASLMDFARNETFAGACFAKQQDRRIGWSDKLHVLQNRSKRLTLADKLRRMAPSRS